VVQTWLNHVPTSVHAKTIAMEATVATRQPSNQAGFSLFDTVPDDLLHFGHGHSFDAKKAALFLSLRKADVGRIASVSESSVRYDDHIPEQVKIRLEEIAATINLVAKQFNGDSDKTGTWFKARNPLLGDISPREMIRLGRYERLRRFIIHAMSGQTQVK
jgi:hypothetical protein